MIKVAKKYSISHFSSANIKKDNKVETHFKDGKSNIIEIVYFYFK
jgi:hypothetical protein